MTRKQLSAVVAGLTAVAMIAAGCSTFVQGQASIDTAQAPTSSSSSSSSSSSVPTDTRTGSTSTSSTSETSETTTSSSSTAGTETPDPPDAVRVALYEPFASYNPWIQLGDGLDTDTVLAPVLPRFSQVGNDGLTLRLESVGSFNVSLTDPPVVQFVISQDAVWSDGVPVSSDDFLLAWLAFASPYKAPGTDDFLFDSYFTAWRFVKKPKLIPGSKNFTLLFEQLAPGIENMAQELLPAHIALEQVGMTVEEFSEAIANDDIDALMPLAEFYNNGWNIAEDGSTDLSLMPSAGPYMFDQISADGRVRLVRNPLWWGTPGKVETIVFVPTGGYLDQLDALKNGDIDVVWAGTTTPDILAEVQSLGEGFNVQIGATNTYEHLDFNFTGIFAKRELREAFAACVPRQQIVDGLFKSTDPNASVLQSLTVFQRLPDYPAYAAVSPWAAIVPNPEVTTAKLAEGGYAGEEVKIGIVSNSNREQIATLIADSCRAAGFAVSVEDVDDINVDTAKDFDITIGAWVATGGYRDLPEIYSTGGGLNYTGYSNPAVDALLTELNTSTNYPIQLPLAQQIDVLLATDIVGLPLATYPGIEVTSSRLSGVGYSTDGALTKDVENWEVN